MYINSVIDNRGYITYDEIVLLIIRYRIEISDIYNFIRKELKLEIGWVVKCRYCLTVLGIVDSEDLNKPLKCHNCNVELTSDKEIHEKVYFKRDKINNKIIRKELELNK